MLSEQELRPLLQQALVVLASCGISHDDIKLDNFHFAVGKGSTRQIMAVDLERVDVMQSPNRIDWLVQSAADALIDAYPDHL